MKLSFKFVFILIVLLICGFFIFSNFSKNSITVKNKTLKVKSIKRDKQNNIIIIKGVVFYNSEKGKIVWKLKSKIAHINKNKNLAFLDNVTFYFKKENIILKANRGIYNLATKDANVFNNVEINGTTWQIFTDNVTFYNKSGEIITNSPFKLKGENFYLTGKKLKGFLNSQKFIITGRVDSKWLKN